MLLVVSYASAVMAVMVGIVSDGAFSGCACGTAPRPSHAMVVSKLPSRSKRGLSIACQRAQRRAHPNTLACAAQERWGGADVCIAMGALAACSLVAFAVYALVALAMCAEAALAACALRVRCVGFLCVVHAGVCGVRARTAIEGVTGCMSMAMLLRVSSSTQSTVRMRSGSLFLSAHGACTSMYLFASCRSRGGETGATERQGRAAAGAAAERQRGGTGEVARAPHIHKVVDWSHMSGGSPSFGQDAGPFCCPLRQASKCRERRERGRERETGRTLGEVRLASERGSRLAAPA
eukprot:450182-Pleurochrysis_carterae.AAC.1